MDRVQTYRGQLVYETDVLEAQQFPYEALGLFAIDLMGVSTVVSGLACGPTTPASLNVKVAPGRIYTLASLDTAALGQFGGVGGLSADTNADHQILKQGLLRDTTTLAITPPVTGGQSQVYLIQAQLQEVDDATTSTQFYNVSDPSSPIPHDVSPARRDKCVLNLKAGTAATTGSQVAPSADVGWTGLWDITVANGASTIIAGNIVQHAGAPFLAGIASLLSPIFSGLVTIGGALDLTGVISPSQITSNQNNYTPAGYSSATILRLTSDASRTVTGMAAPTGEGGVKLLRNVGSFDIVLANLSGSSTSANQFNFGFDRTLSAGRSILLVYDAVSGCWRDTHAIRKATAAEILAGSNDEAFITPAGVKNALVEATLFQNAGTIVTGSAGSAILDLSTVADGTLVLGANATLPNPTNAQPGMSGAFRLVQPASGGPFTLSYGTSWKRPGGPLTLSVAASANDVLVWRMITSTLIVYNILRSPS